MKAITDTDAAPLPKRSASFLSAPIAQAERLACYSRDTLNLDRAGIRDELRAWSTREGLQLPNSLLGEIATYVASIAISEPLAAPERVERELIEHPDPRALLLDETGRLEEQCASSCASGSAAA